MNHINPDALHNVEEPPIENCPLAVAKKALSNTILIGSLQYDELYRLSNEEIALQAKRMIRD